MRQPQSSLAKLTRFQDQMYGEYRSRGMCHFCSRKLAEAGFTGSRDVCEECKDVKI